ncbi:MAG: hypothetical protein U1D55_14995 [Phycisphaerae bacterium]
MVSIPILQARVIQFALTVIFATSAAARAQYRLEPIAPPAAPSAASQPAEQRAAAPVAAELSLPPQAPASPTTEPASADGNAPESAPASEPSDGTQIPLASQPPRAFRFDELLFDVGFDAEWRRRKTEQDSGSAPYRYRQTNSFSRFEETLGSRGAGSVINDRFMRYAFDLRYGLSQERYDESRLGRDLSSTPHGDLLEYDVRTTLFPAGKLSANLFASQLDDRVPRAFLPSLDRRRERYGAELVYSDAILPMRLSFERLYQALSTPTREELDEERNHETNLRYEAAWLPSANQQLRLNYEHADLRDRYSGTPTDFSTIRNYLTLDHTLLFGPGDRSRLETLARIQNESGDLARDQYEISSNLRLQHSDALATTYRVQYLKESFEAFDTDLVRGDVGLSHRLGESLDTSLNLWGLTRSADAAGDGHEWGASADVAFHRETGLGRFSANVGYTHNQTDVDGDAGDGVVISENATFRDPLPVYLNHVDVRIVTIVVTDAARRRVFQSGRDYNVIRVGRYIALTRVQNGDIANGQTVLVGYRYRVGSGFRSVRDRGDLRVQHEFKNGLAPYYAGSMQAEGVNRSRFLSYLPRDVERHRIGVNYRRPRWSGNVEYEYNDDSIDPYDALHLSADAAILDKSPHTLGARASYSYFDFGGMRDLRGRHTSLLDLGLNYDWRLGPTLDATAVAAYRYEGDSLSGITHGVDVSGAVNWRIGRFTLLLEAEYDQLDLPGSSDGDFSAWIKLRREIPVIESAKP